MKTFWLIVACVVTVASMSTIAVIDYYLNL